MDTLVITLIIVLIALPCYLGLKKIASMFGSKNECGCGSNKCQCQSKANSSKGQLRP